MRQLIEADRERIMAYIKKEPELNLLFSSAIEKYGICSANVHVYAAGVEENWDCLLMQYYDDYILYSHQEQLPLQEIADFLRERQVDCIRGKVVHVKPFQIFYPERVLKENNLCCYNRTEWEFDRYRNKKSIGKEVSIKRLYSKDSAAMMDVYLSAEEFARTFQYPEKSEHKMKTELEDGELAVGVYEKNKLMSVARTSGSDGLGSMVVCVATNPVCRGKGYASLAVQTLCDMAFEIGKQFLCLYYSSPVAGKIYTRIGFKTIGDYAMLR